MDKRLLRVVAITSGLTVVGAIMGIPTHNARSWYQSVANDPAPTLWGAGLGFNYRIDFVSGRGTFPIDAVYRGL